MKRLESIRLVNWYHFEDQLFRLNGSCLLLGDNGSGKSTVLDAVQLALVADMGEVRFNKAANEKGHRTLYGYVRHKLGSEDESRPGHQRYGRGAATSYVLLRFGDDHDPTSDFVCGVVLEAGEADTEVGRHHFILPRARIEDVPAVGPEDVVRPSREFRALLRELPDARPCPDVSTYRDELRHRLGALPPSFHRLLVKALDFKPLGQVRDFVFNYLLDPRPVDTASLQANLENYKRLEAEAAKAEQRIRALDTICELGERILHERQTAESHRFLSLRAALEEAGELARALDEQAQGVDERRAGLAAELERHDAQLSFFRQERDRVLHLLHDVPAFAQIRALQLDLERTRRELKDAREADAESRRRLAVQGQALELLLSEPARELRRARPELFDKDDLTGTTDQPALIDRVRRSLAREGELGGRDLGGWTRRLDVAAQALGLAEAFSRRELDAAREEGRALEAERDELDRGRLRYDDGPAALLHLLRQKLKGEREPMPLCELIEIRNERWRDAVEGYLNTRRFDVVVAPADFPRALSLYERHKRAWPLPGRREPVFISGVGLPDMERILVLGPRAERRSLAEQVETSDALARAYVDQLLGDVICCDGEQELRRHRRAITDSVMVYQNHVARQTSPSVYARHFIGSAARLRRRDEIERRLGELAERFSALAASLQWLKGALEACARARTAAAALPGILDEAQRVPDLQVQEATLQRQLDSIDRKELELLEAERAALEDRLAETQRLRDAAFGEEKALSERARLLAQQRADAEVRRSAAATSLDEAFAKTPRERRDAYEARYAEERRERRPAEVREVFDRQYRGISTRADNLVQELIRRKTEYANDYGFSGEVLGEGYADHAQEREAWRESRLPEYRGRIARAKEEAIQQLTEDIVFRLRENLLRVRGELDNLNRALKDVPFGSDRYSFTLEVDPQHKPFYDLVMDAGQFEKESLFGGAALSSTETRRSLEDLFNRLISDEARNIKTELEARADYREYFNYDLKIHHADGTVSRYDRVAADKSGGETQTPYYIAVLASMFRLYRQTSVDQRPTCGLVLLDEAFGKMDGPRIEATLRFARGLSLQLLLATPKERSELVTPWVETSLYIHKDPQSGAPTVLPFDKEFWSDAEPHAPDGETQAPGAVAGGT